MEVHINRALGCPLRRPIHDGAQRRAVTHGDLDLFFAEARPVWEFDKAGGDKLLRLLCEGPAQVGRVFVVCEVLWGREVWDYL